MLQRGLVLNDDPQDVECVLRTVRAVWRAVEAVSPDDPDPTTGLAGYGALDERSFPKQSVAYPFRTPPSEATVEIQVDGDQSRRLHGHQPY